MAVETPQSPLPLAQTVRAPDTSQQLNLLTRLNTAELLDAFGLGSVQRGRTLLTLLARPHARRFARQLAHFDALIAHEGLRTGGTWLLNQTVRGLKVQGVEHLPRSGALLIVANHPGLTDALALFATIPRPDLRIVAAERDLLHALPGLSRYLLPVSPGTAGRTRLVRQVARHLRNGGAILTFPGGQIEPDPAVLPGAAEALAAWSDSMRLFVRLTSQITVVPAIISGVLDPTLVQHPLTRLRRTEQDRRWLAATLQLVRSRVHPVTVRMHYGIPMQRTGPQPADIDQLAAAVLAQAHAMIMHRTAPS